MHGFPKVMGVLTHLDSFKDNKRLKKTKKVLKHRFWAEIYQGACLTPYKQTCLHAGTAVATVYVLALSWESAHQCGGWLCAMHDRPFHHHLQPSRREMH